MKREERVPAPKVRHKLRGRAKIAKIRKLVDLAAELDVTPAQLALAWTASNPHVSTVILGASSVEQVQENLKALDVIELVTPEVRERLEAIFS